MKIIKKYNEFIGLNESEYIYQEKTIKRNSMYNGDDDWDSIDAYASPTGLRSKVLFSKEKVIDAIHKVFNVYNTNDSKPTIVVREPDPDRKIYFQYTTNNNSFIILISQIDNGNDIFHGILSIRWNVELVNPYHSDERIINNVFNENFYYGIKASFCTFDCSEKSTEIYSNLEKFKKYLDENTEKFYKK